MKKVSLSLLLLAAVAAVLPVGLLMAKDGKNGDKNKAALPHVAVRLGNNLTADAGITASTFGVEAARGIKVSDAALNGAQITGFTLTYAEKLVYEDSVGNPLVVTEYNSEGCTGDTLSHGLLEDLKGRPKPGDTLFFDAIHIRTANGQDRTGKALKFWIVP